MAGVKEPYNLSERIKWLYDYYFQGVDEIGITSFSPLAAG